MGGFESICGRMEVIIGLISDVIEDPLDKTKLAELVSVIEKEKGLAF